GPALRASAVKPLSALKGSDDGHSGRGLMSWLIAAQMALCVFVLFVAGLFVATFQRLSNRPLGFAPGRILAVTAGTSGKRQPPEVWMQVAGSVRQAPGVESVAVAGWTFFSGNRRVVLIRPLDGAAETPVSYGLDVSRGFFETMGIGWIDGRDF